MKGGILMSIPAFLTTLWGAVCSPSGQAAIGMLNLGCTGYTAVKATQNSNKLSSLQSTCYGIATELKDIKTNTSDLFTISDMEALVSGATPPAPTTTTPTATTTTAPAQTPTPAEPAVTAHDNVPPAWAQQLMQQQMEQAAVIKNLMQQNGGSVPATTVNVNPTPTVPAVPTAPPATATDSVPTPDAPASVPTPVDPTIMAFLQQQADAMNKLANAVTALETSITEIESVLDDTDSSIPTAPVVTTPPTTTTTTTTPPTPPVGG